MAVDVSLTLVDAYARQGVKRFEGTATTLAQAILDADDLEAAFLDVSGMGVTKRTYTQDVAENIAADAGINVDAGATIHCRLNNGKMYALKIPGVDVAIINPDGSVDLTNAAVTTLIALFGNTGPFRVSEGNYIVSALYGELDR